MPNEGSGQAAAVPATTASATDTPARDPTKLARRDLGYAIAFGGILTVTFAIGVGAAWYFAATLFLIFAGMLLGLALNAMTNALGRWIGGPHTLRLVVVCIVSATLFGGVMYLGGATIAQQATALSNTIKSQIATVKTFLEQHGVDTSYLELGSAAAVTADSGDPGPAQAPSPARNLPSAGTIASSGGAIVTQTLKLVLGTVGAVGNFFIVLFLGLCFAAQPRVYREGLLYLTPQHYRKPVADVVEQIGETLERWLTAQIITMTAVFFVTWIGLRLLGIPGAFILGVQAGILTFIPTIGAIVGGLIVVIASLAVGWVAAVSAFVLFLGVHAMESYVLTPILQRQALDIPPATLFAFQILLGVIFGVWGLSLALPVLAIVKVIIDYTRHRRSDMASPVKTF